MRAAVVLLCVLSASAGVHCWWDAGHQKVAIDAWARLTPEAQARVEAILKPANSAFSSLPEYNEAFKSLIPVTASEEEVPPEVRMMYASTYPDDLKAVFQEFDEGTWHYTSETITQSKDKKTCLDLGETGPDDLRTYLNGIVDYFQSGSTDDPTLKKMTEAELLAFMIHMVGDIFQPFHAASQEWDTGAQCGMVADVGGNKIKIDFQSSDAMKDMLVFPLVEASGDIVEGVKPLHFGDEHSWKKTGVNQHYLFDAGFGLVPITDYTKSMMPLPQVKGSLAYMKDSTLRPAQVLADDAGTLVKELVDGATAVGKDNMCNFNKIMSMDFHLQHGCDHVDIIGTITDPAEYVRLARAVTSEGLAAGGKSLGDLLNALFAQKKTDVVDPMITRYLRVIV